MRKIIVVFSLIALLTFVFPVAASSPVPNFDEGEGGSVMVQLVQLNELFTNYFGEIWQSVRAEQVFNQTELQLREARIIDRLTGLIQEMLQGQVNPSN